MSLVIYGNLQIIVSIDSDGHFDMSSVTDTKNVIKQLQNISYGDHWYNTYKNEDYDNMDDIDWFNFVTKFVQRGICEIHDLSIR